MSIDTKRSILQLSRLERIMDVVFALVIWRLFTFLPTQEVDSGKWSSVIEMLVAEWQKFGFVILAVVIVIIYWLQSNTLFSLVERADGKFAVRAIMQLFFVLLFLFSIRVGTELPASAWTRGFESVAALLLGLSSTWMWSYAAKGRRLLHDDVTDDEAKAVRRRITAEPATALFTLPFIFTPMFWELAWFTYPAVRRFFRRAIR